MSIRAEIRQRALPAPNDPELIASHEAGQVLMAHVVSVPIRYVTIEPRGAMLGYLHSVPLPQGRTRRKSTHGLVSDDASSTVPVSGVAGARSLCPASPTGKDAAGRPDLRFPHRLWVALPTAGLARLNTAFKTQSAHETRLRNLAHLWALGQSLHTQTLRVWRKKKGGTRYDHTTRRSRPGRLDRYCAGG